jgi:hypothetical protein
LYQRLILAGEQSGLQTRIAATGSGSLGAQMKPKGFVELELVVEDFFLACAGNSL